MEISTTNERAMFEVQLIERSSKGSQQLMDLLGLEETLERLAKAKGVRWFGHVWKRDKDVLSALEVVG